MRSMRLRWYILVIGLLLFWGGRVEAATYYVSKSGADSNTCTQAQSPVARLN